MTIERSIEIATVPATIHPHIDNFAAWRAWSPWEDLDPNQERTYTGPAAGVGAGYAWKGNRKAGAGSMRITGSTPERIDLDLEFLKPFKASNAVTFELVPHGAATRVTWRMTGKKNLFFRLFGFIINPDKLIGKDFEKGLTTLKAVAEAR
ncbi:SRPBCC family protein [Skermania piniformis]|uniref:SRPBCC family protein n=1 Tax=Skermania pinensis TaxID=39122 RepID=A0ABX8SDG0_9ACTN|nr:SRPBCC family protein [Skermania piniformis]QXQ15838.1 SRPBCC family protein [Skermania piniformis]